MKVGAYTIKWYHQPPTKAVHPDGTQYEVNGHTVCSILCHGQPYSVGLARRNPIDQWSRAKGRVVALKHALEQKPRSTRAFLWKGYWDQAKIC